LVSVPSRTDDSLGTTEGERGTSQRVGARADATDRDILTDLGESSGRIRARREVRDPRRLVRLYQRVALVGDAVAAAAASATATALRFHSWDQHVYLALSLVVPVLWCLLIAMKRGYEHRFLGRGPQEYRRVWEAGLLLFISTAVLSYSVKGDLARGYIFLVVPLALGFTTAHRWWLRWWARRLRARGLGVQKVLVVGPGEKAAELSRRLAEWGVGGLHAVAVYPRSAVDEVIAAVDATQAHVVAIIADHELSGQTLRRLSWELDEREVDLVVDAGLVDVAGARLSIHPVADLSLLHVQGSRPSGERMAAKAVFDRTLATVLLILASPAMLAIALAVKRTSSGPVLYRQTRVGVNGRPFTMLKFRSMVAGADGLLADLRALSEGNEVLFKLKQDPRVTPVGSFLRRYSLDELPQLINVVRGEMSLVGPRPPLPSEVDTYDAIAVRRLRLRPGLTGLWQVSGRSDLSWEESLRLDLRYVDNWSLALDLLILMRTARAVLSGEGAY
jgi:exopolysaccharide biosynthesis polyprenyl glycosylphosphotransferase